MGIQTGPIPNRSDDLSRERDVKRRAGGGAPRKGTLKPVKYEPPNPEWHEACIKIWEAIPESGMWEFYQQTDLAMLSSLLDDLSAAKKNTRNGVPPAMLLTALYNQLNSFGFSEGDRRRMRIELEAPTEEESSVEDAAVAFYADALNVIPLPRKGSQRK